MSIDHIFLSLLFCSTNTGTFREGDLAIGKNGMQIKGESPHPATTPQIVLAPPPIHFYNLFFIY